MLFPSTKLQDLCLVGVFGGGTKQWLETMAETATLCNKQVILLCLKWLFRR